MNKKQTSIGISAPVKNVNHFGAWIFLAILFGFCVIPLGFLIEAIDPQRCSRTWFGCLAEVFLIATGGWFVGLLFSLAALADSAGKGQRIAAWLLLVWNAGGSILSLSILVMLEQQALT
jgi:hypothetical protein